MRQEFADIEKQWDIKIMVESARKCVSGMLNWMAHGADHGQSLWFKKMRNLHDQLAKHLKARLNTGIVLP